MMTTWQQWLPSFSLREEYIGEEEYVSEAEFCEIDITGKMESLSSKGLTEVEAATLAAPGLRLQLTNIKHTLDHLIQHCMNVRSGALREHPGGDDCEWRVAQALLELNNLVRQVAQQAPPLAEVAMESLRLVERFVQDVALLACSRFISQRSLQVKGIPPELLKRLEAAFGTAALQDDDLWSRLGNSKYHLFTPEKKFGERPHRHGRGGRKSRRSADEDATAGGGRGRGGGAVALSDGERCRQSQSGAAEDEADSDATAMGAAEDEADAAAKGAAEPMWIHLPDGDAHVEISPCALGEPMWIHIQEADKAWASLCVRYTCVRC